MLVYGLQKQQCEKHFRRIHPSLNVVVSRSPFLPLFPHTVLGNCTSTKSRKKERTNIHLPFFHHHHRRSRRDQQQGSREGTCAALTQSHTIFQRPDHRCQARSQKGKLHRLFGCSTSTLSPLCAAPYSVHQHFCTISIESTTIVSRRGGQQQQHRITFTQRDFGIVGSKTSKKEQKSSLNSNSTTTRTHSCSNRTRKQRGLWW